MASLEQITERVRAGVASGAKLDRTLKISLKDEGVIRIDGDQVTNDDGPADLTITTSKDDLEEIAAGRLDPTSAVMTGKLRLSDMGVAMAMQPQMQALFAKMR